MTGMLRLRATAITSLMLATACSNGAEPRVPEVAAAVQKLESECPAGTLDVFGDGSLCESLVQLASGATHNCSIASNGRLYCWGENNKGQLGRGDTSPSITPEPVGVNADWQHATAGTRFTCGIRTGRLYCWGDNFYGQLGNGTTAQNASPVQVGTADDWQAVTAGNTHACGMRSGNTLYCWGSNSSGKLGIGTTVHSSVPVQVAAGTSWQSVSAGSSHTCAISAGGLYCWGDASLGRLGNGSSSGTRTTPLRIGSATDWQSVSAGGLHTCGIRTSSLYCWGNGASGALGNGGTAMNTSPTQAGSATGWQSVSTGNYHTCGRRSDSAYCWGSNSKGQLGAAVGSQSNSPVAVGLSGSSQAIDTGDEHSCGIRAGALSCWGNNAIGQLGLGWIPSAPARVAASVTTWQNISAGGSHSCGTRDDGAPLGVRGYCWGAGNNGALGTGTFAMASAPTLVSNFSNAQHIAAGGAHSCGTRSDLPYCWGSNQSSQLGNGSGGTLISSPVQSSTLTPWQFIAAGNTHSCGIRAGALYCWGGNANGQLGIGSTTTSKVPAQVGTATDWQRVAAGTTHSCGIRAGALYCWGSSAGGQLGTGGGNTSSPIRVGTDGDWEQVTTGSGHTCGTRAGSLYCWGGNATGQLGDNTTTNRSSPTQIAAALSWQRVVAGYSHTCGISSNRLYCWGSNSYGQLGLGTSIDSRVPAQVGLASDWQNATAGTRHSCGLRDGALYCWGDNATAQLGFPNPVTPTPVASPLTCPTGYSGDTALGCVDTDECLTDNGGCDALTTCINTPGSSSCGPCPEGYVGSGATGCVHDLCPDDPDKLEPGACGCGALETDSDGDTSPDCVDGCPSDESKVAPGSCGCGASETDSDSDGVADCIDQCPGTLDSGFDCLPIGQLRTRSIPQAVYDSGYDDGFGVGGLIVQSKHPFSADGSTFVGFQREWNGVDSRALRWSAAAGVEWLQDLFAGRDYAEAWAVSADGEVVSGTCWSSIQGSDGCRWNGAHGSNPAAARLGDGLYGDDVMYPYAMAWDGATVAGGAHSVALDRLYAFRWTAAGFTDLGNLVGGGDAVANDISADGSVVVGCADSDEPDVMWEPFRWTQATGMVGLGLLSPGGQQHGTANAVSADGDVIVGWTRYRHDCDGQCSFQTQERAFRWTEVTGLVPLPIAPSTSYTITSAYAVSPDGTVILISTGEPFHVVWSEAHGSERLDQVFTRLGIQATAAGLTPVAVLETAGTTYLTGIGRDLNDAPLLWRAAFE